MEDYLKQFKHLVLLIGTNPLPNYVVAHCFLCINPNIQHIWLVHSEENKLQTGTDKQARNLENLLRERWEGSHQNLRYPLSRISISDVSNANIIIRDIKTKMLKEWQNGADFHLNYTGGTKAMATHVYRRLQEFQRGNRYQFSYIDANNFRLVVDEYGVVRFEDCTGTETDDLREIVSIDFKDLIALHGFQRINHDKEIDCNAAREAYEKFLDTSSQEKMSPREGLDFEAFVYLGVRDRLEGRNKNTVNVFHNWLIRKPNWTTKFQLDVMILHGYHLTGISCTARSDKDSCKSRGFEIIHRTKQIGGDEAGSILITRADRNTTKNLQDELTHDTGGQDNILVLGVDDLRKEDNYLTKIENFIFDKNL